LFITYVSLLFIIQVHFFPLFVFLRVIVLDKDQIKEFGSPDKLKADKTTIFHSMAKDAGLVSAT
jgi:hypothetical protein